MAGTFPIGSISMRRRPIGGNTFEGDAADDLGPLGDAASKPLLLSDLPFWRCGAQRTCRWPALCDVPRRCGRGPPAVSSSSRVSREEVGESARRHPFAACETDRLQNACIRHHAEPCLAQHRSVINYTRGAAFSSRAAADGTLRRRSGRASGCVLDSERPGAHLREARVRVDEVLDHRR